MVRASGVSCPATHLLVAAVQGSIPTFFYYNFSSTYFTIV
jgi:hypothetical protein